MVVSSGEQLFPVTVTGSRWLSHGTFELRFQRPVGFDFAAGQKIRLVCNTVWREYSLISAPHENELAICVRSVSEGKLSSVLAQSTAGDGFHISPAFGYFLFQPSEDPAVFVATGTGIAPFMAFVGTGVRPHLLLHGVRQPDELYYRDVLTPLIQGYTGCLSRPEKETPKDLQVFHGRVTAFLEQRLKPGVYDFYLCGRGEMLRDATHIIDQRFSESKVFSELFF